jgi:DNA-binding transcriptional LysR family regulator
MVRPTEVGSRLGLGPMRAFAEIMNTGSVTAAARVLGMSQPAVSRMIAEMERDIGFELFYRDKGRLVPTKDGLMLADEVELALAGVARVRGLIRDISSHSVGEVRMIAPPSFVEGVLPGLIASFMTKFPGVRISIDSRSIPTTKTMLATRVVDCAFMRLPLERDDLIAEKMTTSSSGCVLLDSHPLAARTTLTPGLIGDAPLVSLGLVSPHGRQIEQIFRDRNLRPNIVVECHTTSAACAMARNGIGIAILNEMLARSYMHGGLVYRPFEPSLINEYAFVTSAQTRMSRLVEAFRDEARSFFSIPSPK